MSSSQRNAMHQKQERQYIEDLITLSSFEKEKHVKGKKKKV
jgi:hypothetical protein